MDAIQRQMQVSDPMKSEQKRLAVNERMRMLGKTPRATGSALGFRICVDNRQAVARVQYPMKNSRVKLVQYTFTPSKRTPENHGEQELPPFAKNLFDDLR